MIDAYEEPASQHTLSGELTLAAIKQFLLVKGGKVRYAEIFDHFRDQIFDSSTGVCLLILFYIVLNVNLIVIFSFLRYQVSRVSFKLSH